MPRIGRRLWMERDTASFYRDGMQPLRLLPSSLRPRLSPAPAFVRSDPVPDPAPACAPGAGTGPDILVLPTDGRAVTLRLRRPVRLRVFGGRAWITRAGHPDDHWLEPGQTLDLPAPAGWFGWRIVVSGEGASLVTLKTEVIE